VAAALAVALVAEAASGRGPACSRKAASKHRAKQPGKRTAPHHKHKHRRACKRKKPPVQQLPPGPGPAAPAPAVAERSLGGAGNNPFHPTWGQSDTRYLRIAPANYADGVSQMADGPATRYLSNRVFNDVGQNLFSENGVSQWGWAWGQFMDHDFGLRDETAAEHAPIAFTDADPLERFTNDLGVVDFSRTPAAPGTGSSSPRQQLNTNSSYIDGSVVYGDTPARLDWLRQGTLDGDPTNNSAKLLLPGGYLPRADARGDASSAPPVDLMGALMGTPDRAVIAGDVRANENMALTSIQTLFAREHNRIVDALPGSLSQEARFQIARRVVGAEEQWITYHDFLPALGVQLPPYHGYDPGSNATLGSEFATVGYRAHSMIHGEFEVTVPSGTYSAAQLDSFEAQGIEVTDGGGELNLGIPLNAAFGNPDLMQAVGAGPMLSALGGERQYRNDEQIDESLRSVLFGVPKPGAADPAACGLPTPNPDCFNGVTDLGATDVERGRDHGMPTYNDLRRALGLAPRDSFRAVTGEATESFPSDPQISPTDPIDDPDILDFTSLRDADGNPIALGSPEASEDAVSGVRRTPLAARLKAIYGDVESLDAFVGMVSEPHVPGTEFGELQLASWRRQFTALRDGDRFFYGNDPELARIRALYGIDYRQGLADLIRNDAGASVAPNVFRAPLD
jgi:peroxidase